MIAKIPNLWPQQLGPANEVTPRAVLLRQAQILAERSAGSVRATIASRFRGRDCIHTMSIIAPEIEDFHFFVLRVRHNVERSYPARIYVMESEERAIECETESDFFRVTRDVLHDTRITGVIQSLLQQLPANIES